MTRTPKDRNVVSSRQSVDSSDSLDHGVNLLKHAATLDDADATFLLAEMNFYGNFSHPRNYTQAFQFYNQLASNTGNSTAQYMLAFMYATGVGGSAPRDQALALLHHTFAAEQSNTRSEMTLGFRYHTGIGTMRNCDKAARFYKTVADKAILHWRSGPPGGRHMIKHSHTWADDDGGIYGEGASVSSSGFNADRDGDQHSHQEDVMEYLDLLSRKGDDKATFALAKMYYDGSRTHRQDLRKARRLFSKITKQYWDKQGKVQANGSRGIDRLAGKAAAYTGRMFLRGENLEQSYETAASWFRRGIANGDPHSQYLMGVMYRDGLGVPKDHFKAANYFKAAADDDFIDAQSSLGVLFLDQGEVETASRYFELAARHGHLEAVYYLAELTYKGIGREKHCGTATIFYKMVAESIEGVHSSFEIANKAYEGGDLETALVTSMMAAEQGYESAQNNAAYLLDEHKPLLSITLPWSSDSLLYRRLPSRIQDATLALAYWTRSAKQGNIDSLLKMGDCFLSGSDSSSNATSNPAPSFSPSHSPLLAQADPEKASICYQTAAEVHRSAQAFWNLGWMHENGVAVEQDFHMAKRYYDLALEMNPEAYLPVKLALIKLRARSYWNTFIGGSVNGIRAEDAQEDAQGTRQAGETRPAGDNQNLTMIERIRKFFLNINDEDDDTETDYRGDNHADQALNEQDLVDKEAVIDGHTATDTSFDDEATENLHTGESQQHQRQQQPKKHPSRRSQTVRDEYLGDLDIDVDVDDDGLLDTLIIIGLASTLAFLIYYRQQRQQQQQTQPRQRQPPRQDTSRRADDIGNRLVRAAGITAADTRNGSQTTALDAARPTKTSGGSSGDDDDDDDGTTAAAAAAAADTAKSGDRVATIATASTDSPNATGNSNGAIGDQSTEESLFPQPGDPEYTTWTAGGVGH